MIKFTARNAHLETRVKAPLKFYEEIKKNIQFLSEEGKSYYEWEKEGRDEECIKKITELLKEDGFKVTNIPNNLKIEW